MSKYQIISFVNMSPFASDDLAETVAECARLNAVYGYGYSIYSTEDGWLTASGVPGGKPPWGPQ